MPNQPAQPVAAHITPALLKTHSVTPEEYASIEQKLGRTPSLTELGIFSVMWSEHCSYKSSRVHLRRLPTQGTRLSGPGAVVQGPGENAGIIDVGDGWACAFKIESHNHPSYIEPYQGAATGVGGILRDIFTMGARPLAVMDSLRFGPLAPTDSQDPETIDFARNRQTMRGVVHGVGGYGNCFGVPNLGGETRFEPCYSGNPLLNAFALGLVRTDEIFYAKAEGVGNPVFYVGAKTGRDGIHGATMASEEFTEGLEQKRPNVQMGDPFLEKLLLEACLEVMKTGAVLGIQDMGAAGLTCSTCEMGARGALGVTIELDRVPQRETGMSSYEIMLSESQERMLLVAEKGREAEVLAVFAKWGLDCAEVGTVTADDVMRVYHGGVLEAEIPNKALTDEAPVYHREVGTWTSPVPQDPPAWVLEELSKPRDYTADLKRLLASPNICSKRWIYEQYDSMVQTNTVQGPGSEAGVIRIKGTGSPAPASTFETGEPASQSGHQGVIAPLATHASPPSSPAERPLPPPPQNPEAFNLDPTLDPSLDPTQESFSSGFSAINPELPVEAPVQHEGFFARFAHLIADSTPKGEATLEAGDEDATNPVLHPGPEHVSGTSPGPAPDSGQASASLGSAAPRPERGLAMALAGNGRWCYLDPRLGAMHAVAEAARKVACTGATPVAATNCLNFGNPQKPEIMAQLSLAIDGIAEACTALGTPITGGNVSLYNETNGEAIYPTPVIGVVGILDDVTKAVPNAFQHRGDAIVLLHSAGQPRAEVLLRELGATAFAQSSFGCMWGTPPDLNLTRELAVQRLLVEFAQRELVTSASDLSDGGLATALARACVGTRFGAWIHSPDRPVPNLSSSADLLFGEHGSTILITCKRQNLSAIQSMVSQHADLSATQIGQVVDVDQVGNDSNFKIWQSDRSLIEAGDLHGELLTAYTDALAHQLSESSPA